MERTFKPMPTAEAWQLSNAWFPHVAPPGTVDLFDRAGMDALVGRAAASAAASRPLSTRWPPTRESSSEIITPHPDQRGCQLSVVLLHGEGRALFDELTRRGVVADWREPNVIPAPVPCTTASRASGGSARS